MSKNQKYQNSKHSHTSYQNQNLQSIFRAQIVQQYPYQYNNTNFTFRHSDKTKVKIEQQRFQNQDEYLEKLINGQNIIQEYQDSPYSSEQKQLIKRKPEVSYSKQAMEVQHFPKNKQEMEIIPQKLLSKSSEDDNILRNSRQNSAQKLPFFMRNKYDDDSNMDIQINHHNYFDFQQLQKRDSSYSSCQHNYNFVSNNTNSHLTYKNYSQNINVPNSNLNINYNAHSHLEAPMPHFHNQYYYANLQKFIDQQNLQNKERLQKIAKLQQIGCKCRKSKCLKMYCQCFHLQIHCNQNCDCVGCGNMKSTNDHKQAIIQALTRNPKAFNSQGGFQNVDSSNQILNKEFKLGVEENQIKKGCKCRKTKCQKKYCECYNSKIPCGIFCKCEGCENGKCDH